RSQTFTIDDFSRAGALRTHSAKRHLHKDLGYVDIRYLLFTERPCNKLEVGCDSIIGSVEPDALVDRPSEHYAWVSGHDSPADARGPKTAAVIATNDTIGMFLKEYYIAKHTISLQIA